MNLSCHLYHHASCLCFTMRYTFYVLYLRCNVTTFIKETGSEELKAFPEIIQLVGGKARI